MLEFVSSGLDVAGWSYDIRVVGIFVKLISWGGSDKVGCINDKEHSALLSVLCRLHMWTHHTHVVFVPLSSRLALCVFVCLCMSPSVLSVYCSATPAETQKSTLDKTTAMTELSAGRCRWTDRLHAWSCARLGWTWQSNPCNAFCYEAGRVQDRSCVKGRSVLTVNSQRHEIILLSETNLLM